MSTNLLVALRSRIGLRRQEPRERAHAPVTTLGKGVHAAPAVATQSEHNPYLDARREWNERYGDYIQAAHHWRTVALVSSLVALIAVAGVAYIGAQNKVVPYVVEVDKLGEAAAVARADRATPVDTRVVKAYLARFVADWRTVTIDRQAQKGAIDRVYAMLPGGSVALSKLNDYFRAHNPFTVASKESVEVAVTNLLQLSEKTWQVEWREVIRDSRGEVQGSVRMKASIILGITPPTDEKLALINPLGIYVTDINWSQQI
jgi:type IV secretory pathway TrbF-like protein